MRRGGELLILLEFPVTVNCGRIEFNDAEMVAWKRNMEAEAAAVVPYMFNHPSIVMWSMTNESNNWEEYESGPLYRHFKKLDPTRPAIRASYNTPDAVDVHSYAAMWKGSAGDFELRCRTAAAKARKANLPFMVTEYLGGADLRVLRKWFGPAADSRDIEARPKLMARWAQFQGQRALEQTEAARRLDFCCILPFGPGCWSPEGQGAPTFYAVRNAFAPVGVSLDESNQHFAAGQTRKSDFAVINDTDAKVKATVTFSVYATDPGLDPEAQLPKPLQTSSAQVEVNPQSKFASKFEWAVPEAEGQYFLLARLERPGAKPVVSRRPVYAIKREPAPQTVTDKKVLVIEEGNKLATWVGKVGCKLVDPAGLRQPTTAPGQPPVALVEAQLVILGRKATSQPDFAALAVQFPGFVQRGGRLIVLEQFDWPAKLKDLLAVQIARTDYDFDDDNAPADVREARIASGVTQADASGGSSRVFRWEQTGPGLPGALWKGIPDEYLWDWNGQGSRVARVSMSSLPGRARVLVKYAEAERDDLRFIPVAVVPHGQGDIMYFMLQTAGRYDDTDPDFDPVVERLMINLLGY